MQYINLIGLLSLMQLFAVGLALPKPRLGGYYPNGAPHLAVRDAVPEALTPSPASGVVNRDLETKKRRALDAIAARAAAPKAQYTAI